MNLEKQAIDILRTFAGNEPYQLGYSGGKDSDVILHLAKKAGVPFVAVHNLTTVDAPETVRYVKKQVGSADRIPKDDNVAADRKA
jgi:phosphoadenosine phosphosulfate reductase